MIMQIEQRSAEWHEQRIGKVTGSVVGGILEHAPYMTRGSVMRQMVRAYHKEMSEFNDNNPAVQWGSANEDGAIVEFTMETGLSVIPAPFVSYEDWAGASPDGYVDHGGLIEVKCPYKFRKESNPKFQTAKDQPHYYDQMQFQMICTGEEKCYFYQWAPNGSELEIVKKDENWAVENIPKLKSFYNDYLNEIDNPDHLAPLRQTIDTPDAVKLVNEYDELGDALDRAKQRQGEIMDALVLLADGKDAIVAGRNLTRMERAGSVSYAKAIKDLAPDADLEKYRGKASEFWRLF